MYNCKCGKVPQELYFTEVKTMEGIVNFFADIWDFVMTILVNAGVTAVEDWVNPFRKDAE